MLYAITAIPVLLMLLVARAMFVVAARTDRQSERQHARRRRGWQP
jgi:hypothetical protein